MAGDYTSWHVGMKVVCVDDEWVTGGAPLQEGAVYHVSGIRYENDAWGNGVKIGPAIIVDLVGVINPHSPRTTGFRAERFRPVQTRKTDISIFTAMLRPIDAKLKETV